jgi:Ca2+-binding RTX toxin-like protein
MALLTSGLTVYGNNTANTIYGTAGTDIIYGQTPGQSGTFAFDQDQIHAGDGADEVHGGDGDDKLWGDGGGDTLYGDYGVDYLFGGAGDDHLYGGELSDHLHGGAGADILEGGTGDDFYFIDDALDTIVEGTGINDGFDLVTSTISYTLGTGVERLVLQNSAGLTGTGNALYNLLIGDSGNDTLSGLGADDKLYGRGGADTLSGGTGADTFKYEGASDSTASATDHILDFSAADGDLIDLVYMDANVGTGGVQPFNWIGTTAFHNVAGELRYSVAGGNATVEGDTNGDGIADLVVLLQGVTILSQSQFIL